jgi:RNase P/RNase MRP subunit p30
MATSAKQQEKKVKRIQEIAETNNAVEINNRFNPLTIEETSNQKEETRSTELSRPPPLYVHGVINYPNTISQIRELLAEEQYNTKSLINNTVKINCTTPASYRKLVRYFRQGNIVHHTYQLKEERA